MNEWANQVYKQVFKEDAPWTKGTPEERQAAWEKFNAEAEAAVIPDEDWERFHAHLLRNREPKPHRRRNLFADEEDAA